MVFDDWKNPQIKVLANYEIGGIHIRGKFVTAINCMDGRAQIPVIEWLKEKYSADFVDMITEPGPVKLLSEGSDKTKIISIRRRVEISVKKNNSKIVAIVAHYDCAGNPVGKDVQIQQLLTAIGEVKSWNFDVDVIGLWVDDKWQVSEVYF